MAGNKVAREEMVRLSGQTGVPVIVVGSTVIVGFDRARLKAALGKAGGGGGS